MRTFPHIIQTFRPHPDTGPLKWQHVGNPGFARERGDANKQAEGRAYESRNGEVVVVYVPVLAFQAEVSVEGEEVAAS